MRRISLVLAFLSLPSLLQAQVVPDAASVQQVVDSLARAFVAAGTSPSVAIGVTRGDATVVARAWGLADLENEVAATERSVYRIGSVTKQFTSSAVMQLVQEGKINLESTIGSYLSDLPEAWRPVTITQLLNHTSGIPSYTGLGEGWQARWAEEMDPATIIGMVAAEEMDFTPGTRYAYNNTGYVLLGMLIEEIAGRPWGEELQVRFFAPLGLPDTRNCLTEEVIPRRVHGYGKEDGEWVNVPFLHMTQPYAAGALCSTIADMAKWNRALHTGQIVSPASYELMTTPSGGATRARYGFGLSRGAVDAREMIVHGGGIHGFVTANAWVPDAGVSVTVLTNAGSGGADDLLAQVARAALGMPLLRLPDVVSLSPDVRERYVGTYAMALGPNTVDFVVAVEGDQLTGKLGSQQAIPMLHFGNNTFGMRFDPTIRLIFTMEGERATLLTLQQQGQEMAGPRR